MEQRLCRVIQPLFFCGGVGVMLPVFIMLVILQN